MTDLMAEIEDEWLHQSRRSWDTQDCGIAANLLDRIKTELSEKDARIAELEAALKIYAEARCSGMICAFDDGEAARAALGEKE